MTEHPFVVTISATYGAGGSIVGPRVAERLDLPFLDRAIPIEVSRRMAIPLEQALAHDQHAEHGLGRLLASFAHLPPLSGSDPMPAPVLDEHEFKDETERAIRALAHDGGVILGHAAAFVLADHAGALHARLDGPLEARIARALSLGDADEAEVRRTQHEADRSRSAYAEHFYRANPAEPGAYQLVIDSTAVALDACVELIVTAARARQAEPAPR